MEIEAAEHTAMDSYKCFSILLPISQSIVGQCSVLVSNMEPQDRDVITT
jgi:hypothetical protein